MPNLMPLSTLSALSIYPFADEFPYISEDETMELAQDIEAHGLLHPIVLFQNEILDGRNRLKALGKTNLTSVPTEEYLGDDPIGYIISLNLARRHLTIGQRAALAVVALPYYEAQAADRLKTNVGGGHMGTVNSPEAQSALSGEAREQVADKFGVGSQAVTRAKSLSLNASDLFAEMKAGKRSVNDAYSELQRRQGKSPGATAGDKAKPEPKPEYGVGGTSSTWEREEATYEEKRATAVEALIRTAEHMAAQITRYALTDGDVADATESLSSETASILAEFFSACEA